MQAALVTVDRKHQEATSVDHSDGDRDAARSMVDRLELGADEVHVWRVSLDVSPQQLLALEALLADGELSRAGRFVFGRDRQRFVAARAALRSILGRYLARDARRIELAYAAAGKPELADDSEALGLRFNLSHSHALALVGVTRGRRIGIDVEHLKRDVDHSGIAERFFSDQEVRHLASVDPARRVRAFLEYWTEKEALLKASGKGLSGLSARIDPDGNLDEGALAPQQPCTLRRWHIRRLEPEEGYTAALALEGDVSRVTWFEWSPPSAKA